MRARDCLIAANAERNLRKAQDSVMSAEPLWLQFPA